MKRIFLALFVTSALLSTVSSLSCTFCNDLSLSEKLTAEFYLKRINCQGKVLPCPSEEDVCGSIITHSISMKAENATKNGVLCPACFSNREPCTANYSIPCTGEERHCLTLQGKFTTSNMPVYTSGCSTFAESLCRENQPLYFLTYPDEKSQTRCTKVTSTTNLVTRYFIWCKICQNCLAIYNSEKPEAILCSHDEDVCVYERTRIMYAGSDTVMATQRCGKSSECNRAGSIRSSTKTILINTTCCNQNMCQRPFPTVPSISNDVNGLVCPTCYYPNSDRCLRYNNLQCTGDEKRCVHYTRTENQGRYIVMETLHGCTTDEICEAGSMLIQADERNTFSTIKTDIRCTESGAITWSSAIYKFLMITYTALCVLDI
ncbi:uncharacterized protein LOC143933719 isoform X2 [Lithobates pipiens]